MIRKILDHPKITLSLLTVVTIMFGSYLPNVKMDFSIEQLFSQDDPVIDRFLEFREEFDGVDNIVYLLYESDDPFSYENLIKNRQMVDAFEKINGVSSVSSLTNIDLFTDGGEYLLSPVYENIPKSPDSLKSAKTQIMNSKLLNNYLISDDGALAAILIEIDVAFNEHNSRESILKEIDRLQESVDWEWHQTGLPIIRTRYVQYMIADNIRFLGPVVLMLFIFLSLLFRSWAGLVLPLLVVVLTIIWTLGFMVFSGITINIISYIIPTLLMVVGVSDSVHLLVKYYSTLNELNDKKQAMVDTLQKIGMAIFFTSITTAIGFGALSMVKIQIVKEFGIFTALGVFFAFIITVFLIPSLLMLFEKTPQSTLDRYSTGFRVKIIKKFIKLVRVYPRLIVACGFVISFFGLFGALQINPHSKLLDDLRPGNPLLEDMQLAEEKMGSVLPVEIVIEVNEDGQFEDIQDVSVMSFLNDLAQYVSTIPEVGKVISVSDYLKEINQAMNDGNSDYYQIPQSREIISQYMLLYESEFESFINIDYTKLRIAAQINDIDSRRSAEIENDINKYITSQIPDGLGAEVTGTAFLALRTNNYLVNNLLASFFIALLIITFLMIFLFRSIKIALISILPNIIPMMIMAAVLGFFQIPLRPATAMTFAVAFGIAIDDTLHYLIRYRMELSHQHYRKANDATLLGTGIAMMSTTAILSAGFLVLTLSEFKPTIEFGMLSVITIIAALISDITFLPALLSQIKPKLESLND
jgi:hypothetical protein